MDNLIPDLDILINNVGIFNEVPFEEISDEEWFEMFEVNVMIDTQNWKRLQELSAYVEEVNK